MTHFKVNFNNPIAFFILFLLFGLSACTKKQEVAQLSVMPVFQFNLNSNNKNQRLNCTTNFNYQGKKWQYKQLQFFIANVALKNKQGVWHSWLMKKNAYQGNNVALVGENCADSNNYNVNKNKQKQSHKNEIDKDGHWKIDFAEQLNLQNFTAIRFTVGVPFALNHLNPLTQPSPLNDSSMFWVWQTGHKFLRVELANNKGKQWLFHLGSTGCKSPSMMRSPKAECLQPNRVTVELPLRQGSIAALAFDVHTLLNNMTINEQNFCQSSPNNKACWPLFSALGLSGTINDNKKKTTVFKVITHE